MPRSLPPLVPRRARRGTFARIFRTALWSASFACPTAIVAQSASGSPPALVALLDSLRAVRVAPTVDGVPQYTPATLDRWRAAHARLAARHRAMPVTAWPIADRVDHAVVGTQLAAFDFELRVLQPWARDPGHWVDLVARAPYAELPATGAARERLVRDLAAVPALMTEARRRLTKPAAELAHMAVFHLDSSDEVNQGEPRRPRPPAGVIGWYGDLLQRAQTADPTLVPAITAARDALTAYRDWLVRTAPTMTAPAHVGLDDYAWYVRHVRLVPWSVEDIRLIGERELARARSLLAIEQHRNRGLPALVPAATAEEHERRTREAETWIRTFTAREQLLTIPADIPPQYDTDAFFIDRTPWGGHRHFWDEITYRDPLNNHIHASIPGHRFDGALQRRHPRVIRRLSGDGTRAEGWAFYLEEMYLQAGLLADRPRTRELFYIAQLKRAARIHAELRMQTGAWTLAQAIAYLNAEVPLMETNLARYDLAIYLRRPAYGMNYTIGKAQMEQLLADRQRQLGAAFNVGAFHDAFLGAGSIPISLIRWELTGRDDEMRQLGIVK